MVAGCTLALAPPAGAAFPGTNARIAYETTSGIWTMEPDGSERLAVTNVGTDDHPAFSPDARKIVFSGYVGVPDWDSVPEVHVMKADGSERTPLTTGGGSTPSFSPDGTEIVYARPAGFGVSEVAVMDADGTDSVDLGSGSHPSFSPDGTKIVYELSNAIRVMDADGTDDRLLLTNAAAPTWSPDGTEIAFSRQASSGSGREIWLIDAADTDGSTATKLHGLNDIQSDNPAFSPDGTRVAFRTQDTSGYVIKSVRVSDGLDLQTLATEPSSDHPDWGRLGAPPPETTIDSGPEADAATTDATPTFTFSSDDETATFECRFGEDTFTGCTSPHTPAAPLADGFHTFAVRAVSTAGDPDPTPATRTFVVDPTPLGAPNGRIVTERGGVGLVSLEPDGTDPVTLGVGGMPDVSPDGTRIAYVHSPSAYATEIWTMDADGGDARQVTAPDPRVSPGTIDLDPAFSPDGRTIVFLRFGELCTVDAHGGEVDCLGVLGDAPAVSPDGMRIAFSRGRTYDSGIPSAEGGIYTVAIDGTDEERLTGDDHDGNDSDPAWSPDGATIVFSSDRPPHDLLVEADLYSMSAAGTDEAPLTETPENEVEPDFSPDGTHLVFSRRGDADADVYTMPVAGGAAVRRTLHPQSEWYSAWGRTPDGPHTTIASGPSATTDDDTPTFAFTSPTAGATFECRLDGTPFAACPSSYTTPSLALGDHTLEVRAVGATWVDSSPARSEFMVVEPDDPGDPGGGGTDGGGSEDGTDGDETDGNGEVGPGDPPPMLQHPPADPPATQPAPTPPSPSPSALLPGTIRLSHRALVRTGLVAFDVMAAGPGRLHSELLLPRGVARRLGLRARAAARPRYVVVARRRQQVRGAGRQRVRLRVASRHRRQLRRARRLALILRVTAIDAAGTRTTVSRRLVVRRGR